MTGLVRLRVPKNRGAGDGPLLASVAREALVTKAPELAEAKSRTLGKSDNTRLGETPRIKGMRKNALMMKRLLGRRIYITWVKAVGGSRTLT